MTPQPTAAAAAALACLVLVAVLLLPAVQARGWARAAAKLGASSCFVLTALLLGAAGSDVGRMVLAAMVFGWIGDAFLLSQRPRAFQTGLAAFLLGHALYVAAFVLAGTAPLGAAWLLPAAVALATGVAVWRWLAPHLPRAMRGPVAAYVAVILLMCVTAAAQASGPAARWPVLPGAVLFALSDLAVARERFVRRGPVNRLVGLPLYYVAQLLLAASVAPQAWRL
jgi:uncharacterized membrane protein YhhN